MLAVEFGCLKFHHYLYGRKFICNSDHQLLGKIHLKHLSDAPPRLQRLLLKIQPHDITIKYIQVHQTISKSQQKEPAIAMEIPNRPWQRLGVDIFFQGGKWYLWIADYYSKFPIIHLLPSLTSKDVISAVSSSISVFGIPDEIISDCGSQFVAKDYQDFAARYGFKLTTSSPHYPRGHGFIKRQVQTIKNVFNRCGEDGSDANLALL